MVSPLAGRHEEELTQQGTPRSLVRVSAARYHQPPARCQLGTGPGCFLWATPGPTTEQESHDECGECHSRQR